MARDREPANPAKDAPRKGGRSKTRHRQLSQARAEETRARILQKAREVFAEHGFVGANIREIAREAGTTHSMVTYHFGTKDQLWREALRDMFALLRKYVFEPLPDDLSPRDRFIAITRGYTRYCAEHPEHARLTIAETIRGGERLDWLIEEFVKRDHASVLPMIEELMREGEVNRMPVPSFLYSYVGMVQMPFALAKEARGSMEYDFMQEAAIDAHAEAVLTLTLINY